VVSELSKKRWGMDIRNDRYQKSMRWEQQLESQH